MTKPKLTAEDYLAAKIKGETTLYVCYQRIGYSKVPWWKFWSKPEAIYELKYIPKQSHHTDMSVKHNLTFEEWLARMEQEEQN